MLIGISGKMRSGKDTSYKLLNKIAMESEGNRFKRVAFADPLKEAAMLSIGWDNSNNIAELVKTGGSITIEIDGGEGYSTEYISGREYLQNFGVAAREVYGENFWVELALDNAWQYNDVVITDVRFENEAKAIKEHGGFVFHVFRDKDEQDGTHISEKKLPEELIDYYIDNTGDLDNLKENLTNAFNDIRKREGSARLGSFASRRPQSGKC